MFDPAAAPRLETPRLILRAWRESDFEPFTALMADDEAGRFLTSDQRPLDRAGAWRALALIVGHWALRGHGLFAVEEKASGAFVGRVGLWRPEGWPGTELGWALHPAFRGRGYAFEAARAAGDWAFAAFDLARLVSLIHSENARSQLLARRLGMAIAAPMTHAGMPHDVWEIERAAWTGRG